MGYSSRFWIVFLCLAMQSGSNNCLTQENAQNAPASMANTFLDGVIQTRYLTSVEKNISIDGLMKSLSADMQGTIQEWGVYFIGFAVCIVIGILMIVVMVPACLIFPCCRCCGRCGGGDPEKKRSKKRSSGCCCCCYGTLVVITLGLFLGAIAVYIMGSKLEGQLSGTSTMFDSVTSGIDGLSEYLDSIEQDLEDNTLAPYTAMTREVFDHLDGIPRNSIAALNDATGVMTNLYGLQTFTNQLPLLQRSLMNAEELAIQLNATGVALNANIGSDLSANFTLILNNIHDIMHFYYVPVRP